MNVEASRFSCSARLLTGTVYLFLRVLMTV